MNASLLLLKMKKSALYLFAALLLLVTACDKGQLLDNLPPDTHISLQEINLVGEDRLRSEVTLHWFGTDKDGWLTGYDLSFDGTTWSHVTTQDSTFNFDLPLNSDSTDIDFFVRAIDNDGDVDQSPAYLRIPIKNSPPVAAFDTVRTLPDTGFVAITFFINVEDLDGANNLDSIFLKLNNGSWYPLDPATNTITLVPASPKVAGSGPAKVYVGTSADLQSATIDGFNLEGDNTFLLKARDIAGAESIIDTSRTFFIKRQKSDLILIDGHASGSSPTPEEVYATAFTGLFSTYDVRDLRINNGANVPQVWGLTFPIYLSLYESVFWYSDASEEGVGLLEEAGGALQGYLTAGGKLLISTSFPNTFDNESVIQEFSPMDSLSTSQGLARIPLDSLVVPIAANASAYDSLEASIFVGRATPFYVKSSAEPMFTANLFTVNNWSGPNTVAARTRNGSGQTNMVFVSVELHQLAGRPQALKNFFNEVLLNEFNW